MPFIRILLLSLLIFKTYNYIPDKHSSFISPVKIPLALSASFGELRVDHFHSGLDIKTQGVTGKEVVAAASGYVYRISVSPGGFGNALYVRHPSGYSTVYGHLDRFIPEIGEYVKAAQYEKKSFMVALYPPRDRFPVVQGEVIAYSGNSGSSGGPHLHYEIRKSDGEIPVNPLFFDFGVTDHVKPVIEKLVVYPVNRHTVINGHSKKEWINVRGSAGRYTLTTDEVIDISGKAGFGIRSYDTFDESNNRCSVYSIELVIDSLPVFKYVMDAFSFNESGYINSHIDYAAYQKDKIFIERTYVLPNDRLSAYKNLINRGIYDFDDNRTHQLKIIARDIDGNESTLSFKVRAHGAVSEDTAETGIEKGIMMPYGRTNYFNSGDVSLKIPSGALYDTLNFRYSRGSRGPGMLSALHSIHDIYTPLHRPATLSVRPDTIIPGTKSKMLLVRLDDDGQRIAVSTTWTGNSLTAEVRNFGNYYVALDTIAPEISPRGFSQDANLSGRSEMKIRISDDLSGINYYTPLIDGNWALFEYDQKNSVIIYRFDPGKITKGTMHNLQLTVADNKDNISSFSCSFTW